MLKSIERTATDEPAAADEPDGNGDEFLFTIADLDALPTELPSGTVRYELEAGRLLAMSPTGARHGRIEMRLGALLYQIAERLGGELNGGEVGVILSRDPDTLFGGDLIYYTAASLPPRESVEGYLETPPDIAIEIRSKNERRARVLRKTELYLSAGVKEVWYVEPARNEVHVHCPGEAPRLYTAAEELTSPLLPGVSISLAALFAN